MKQQLHYICLQTHYIRDNPRGERGLFDDYICGLKQWWKYKNTMIWREIEILGDNQLFT